MFWCWPWSENIKKRACRYLLQRYLGNFLEEKLTLDQLSVDLYNGTGSVCDVSLDCEALNELGDTQNWPLEIVDGYMKEISVSIPWSTLLKDDSLVVVNGLSVTVQPKVRAEPASSMLESMWSSMSSSMQLATECLREEVGPQDAQPLEGVEMFAQAIDSILSRVKVKFVNTKLRIEHVPKNSDRGIAFEIHIDNISYFDEAGSEPTPDVTDPDKSKTYIVSTYTTKKIKFDGITLYTDDFPSKLRTMSRSLIMEKSVSSQLDKGESQTEPSEGIYQSTISDIFYETRSVISTIDSELVPDPVPNQEASAAPESKCEEKEPTPDENVQQPDPILFAKLTGQQELSLKLKYNEEIEGPKIEVKILLGSFIVFLSPRQLHTLNELVNALNQPQLEDTSNIPMRPGNMNVQCKPMKQADYQLIEAQLLGNLEKENARHKTSYGWSGPSFDDSDTESEKFHPMSQDNQMIDSFASSASSMSASVTSGFSGLSSQPRIKRNKKVPHIDGDPTADTSHISLRINSVSCILLHRDILIPTSPGSSIVSPSSAKKMKEVAKDFFDRLLPFYIIDGSKSEYDTANQELDKATQRNHLRLIVSEISLDGSEKDSTNGTQTICEASISHLLVRECLYYKTDNDIQSENHDLIHFEWKDEDDNASKRTATRPNIKINYKQTSKYVRMGNEKKPVNPVTDITIKCAPLHIDVELTLIERMSATLFGGPRSASSAHQQQVNVSLLCPSLNAMLRFPIADLRPGISHECRRIRSDYASLQLRDVSATWQRNASQPASTLAITSTTLDLFYHENDHLPAIHIARASMDHTIKRDILKGQNTTPLPTISITFQSKQTGKGPFDSLSDDAAFEPTTSNPMTTSMYIMNNLKNTQPSPFSGKKMAHQSITKHEGSPHGQEEELVIPGTEEEMTEFTNSCIERASIHLDFNLPILSLQLQSKQLYEILYNRINSDLLLWEPQVVDQYEMGADIFSPIYPAFNACKGGYESDSGSESSEEDNLYYSTYDNKLKKNIGATKPVPEKKETHNFCLTFKANKGLLTIYAPVRDSNKRVVPGQMGELVLEAQKLSLCQVSGLNGIPKTSEMCLRATKASLYHEALLTIPSEKPCLRLYGSKLPSHLKSTIYPSGKGVFLKETMDTKDMFTMALKMAPETDSPNMKSLCIALSIEQATLRHRGDKGIAWLTQLIDVLDVVDYPVPGYTPSTVLSQLHVHVWDCAVDYRPLYLPIRAVVALGNFSYSSSLIAETNTSCLRFLAQECDLFLCSIPTPKPGEPVPLDDDKLPDLRKDYVCVVDVGLFELSLRMDNKANASAVHLQTELSASNNMVTVHTCWDSANALFRLVTYVACDGDAAPPAPPAAAPAPDTDTDETLVGLEEKPVEEIRDLSPGEIKHLHDLMEEALKESPDTTMTSEDIYELMEALNMRESKEYLFPDECKKERERNRSDRDSVSEDDGSTHSQVTEELGDPNSARSPRKSKRTKSKSSECSSNTDDEYDILSSEEYCEDDDLAEPVVRWFDGGPPPMIDDHFSVPAGPADVLEAPKSFPSPVLKYTLCEMSINWFMYGGHDFRPASEAAPKKKVTIDTDATNKGSPTSSKREKSYEPYESGRGAAAAYSRGVSWAAGAERVRPAGGARAAAGPAGADLRTRGGAHRDADSHINLKLTKVRFVHETYPKNEEHASRQTLAIQNIEVLDRVRASNINKLLSLYQQQNEPVRKNAYMLVVKLAHMRTSASPSSQESCLKVSVMPLRFILDQDTVNFLIAFFSKLGADEFNEEQASASSAEASGSRQTTPTHRPPVMSVAPHLRDPPPTPTSLGDVDALSINETVNRDDGTPLMETYEAERLVSENLIQLEEDFNRLGQNEEKSTIKTSPDTEPVDRSPIYFRRVIFSPDVPIRLDYQGKRVDLSAGPIAGLLMGLGQLNCSELTLKRLDYRLGLLGVDKLVQWAVQEWLSDIKRHQLPGLLSGIGPMHSFLQFITGIRDLVWLPVEQWRRDGRFVLGLRRGAASFSARTAVAALDLTARLLRLVQATAETAFDMLTPRPTLPLQDAYERRERRRRRRHDPSRHPTDIREGVASAYQTVKEGMAETAATVALAARCESGVGVLRHLPSAAVAPLALAAAGAADLLGGVRAHLAPATSRDRADKWRAPAPPPAPAPAPGAHEPPID